jgi:hypothetical protein
MKTMINPKQWILALLLAASSTLCFAQCDKTATFTSSQTNYYNTSTGEFVRAKDEKTVITITKTTLTIVPGDEEHKVTGPITKATCDWKVPFKEGKSIITAVLENKGRERHATLVIEGKDGKVTAIYTIEESPNKKIVVTANKFE